MKTHLHINKLLLLANVYIEILYPVLINHLNYDIFPIFDILKTISSRKPYCIIAYFNYKRCMIC